MVSDPAKKAPAPTHEDEKRGENAGPNAPPEGRRFTAGNQAAKGFGRPKTNAEMRELARDETGLVFTKWKAILLKGNGNAAVRAGELLMAYAWGKPNQPIVGPGEGPIEVRHVLTSDEKRKRMRELAEKAMVLAAGAVLAKTEEDEDKRREEETDGEDDVPGTSD